MSAILILIFLVGLFLFFVGPQLSKFRATVGIDAQLKSGLLKFHQRFWLMIFGLKTPFLNSLTVGWTFIISENDKLASFNWEQFISHEHAVWLTASLWLASIWAHFQGLNAAAAMTPVISSAKAEE